MSKTMLIIVGILIAFGVVIALSASGTQFSVSDVKNNPLTPTITPPLVFSAPTATPSSAVLNQTSDPTTTLSDLQTANSAIIHTSKGDITLTLYPQDAPKTVDNFIRKANSGFYNNLTFHRVEDWVIQGGDPLGNGTGGGNMPTELNSKPFVVGSLGVARGGDIKVSNDAQFFITKTEASWLNGQYTNFGIVTNGMDVVNKIEIGDKILSITIQQ